MTNSFLILFITIKTEIALILQGVNINRQFVPGKGTRPKKGNSLYFYNSFSSPLPHTPFFYLSLKKKRIEGGRK